MTTIVTRADKGSPLTNTEMDTNLTNLNSYKVEQDISGNATITGNVYLTGSGKRITGDFSNATVANRVMFQTSTTNGSSSLSVTPNGTASFAGYNAHNSSDGTNYAGIQLRASNTEIGLSGFAAGTASHLPMTFYTGGLERMRIDTSGNVGIGAAPVNDFDVLKTKPAGIVIGRVINTDPGALSGAYQFVAQGAVNVFTAALGNAAGYFGTSSNHPMYFYTNNSAKLAIDTSGNVLAIGSGGGLGYGTGAGGTVTQATSRTTSVTINKPTGKITMFSAAGSSSPNSFTVTNSLVSANDVVVLHIAGGNSNVYNISVGWISAGSFSIIYSTTGGTAVDAPVINFAIIKGATA